MSTQAAPAGQAPTREPPRGRQMEKQYGLELMTLLRKDTMGSFHVNVTAVV